MDARYRVVRNLIPYLPDGSTTAGYSAYSMEISGETGSGLTLTTNFLHGVVTAASTNPWLSTQNNASAAVVRQGTTITLSAMVRTSRSRGVNFGILWRNAADVGYNVSPSNASLVADQWTLLSITRPVDALAMKAGIRVYLSGPADVGESLDMAQIMLTEGPDLYPYVDGDQPNAHWDGTPNASTSRGLVFVP